MVSSREPLIYITAIYCNDSFARSQVMPVTGLISSSFCECVCVCESNLVSYLNSASYSASRSCAQGITASSNDLQNIRTLMILM